jgi:hypothetical protein
MGRFLRRRRLGIWIACFAILMNALAPSISHAMALMNGTASLIEVCTVDGTRYISAGTSTEVSANGDPRDGQAARLPGKATVDLVHDMQHCPFCYTHAASFALPVPFAVPLAVTGGHDVFPPLFYQSPTPLFSWSRAHPRGPPALS